MNVPFLLGRIAFGGFFLYNGINHFRQRKTIAQYAGMKKVPAPDVAVALSGAMLLVGGTSVILGIKPKYGALAIVAFLATVSPVIHDFWRAEDPNQRMHDMTDFTKNMAMMAAALALAGVEEPWEASIPIARPAVDRAREVVRRIAS
jgi:uncharacterized membrane protein YphA (DoxX/SURF4 family)